MPDVLTPAEREVVETLRKYLAAWGLTTGSGPAELALLDRLVAEVERLRELNRTQFSAAFDKLREALGDRIGEGGGLVAILNGIDRLRARNEALELVAANASMAAEFTPPFSARGHEVFGALRKALAAINPPTGGAT